ncbi:MAG: glycosyltransferase [Chitinivibrionales bacterium]|nr:glycosyltransferase [Chitinivibrionales bacterium]
MDTKVPTILYLCPDFSPPSAGTRRLYRHVEHLRRAGFDAFIVHNRKGFMLSWHGHHVPIVWMEDKLTLNKDDIIVIPEGMSGIMRSTRHLPCNRVVIVLNWAHIYRNLPSREDWSDYGIRYGITPSPVIKAFLEWSMDLQIGLIANYVDTRKFLYQPEKKKRQIAYSSRKDPSGEILRSIFEKKPGMLKGYEWVLLEDLTEDGYAQILAESKIFLGTSLQEGVPTAALEAMAAGCIVVGYAGVGGSKDMIGTGEKQNCFLVENGDIPGLGRKLEQVVRDDEYEEGYARIIKNALETASRYGNYQREGDSLEAYFRAFPS